MLFKNDYRKNKMYIYATQYMHLNAEIQQVKILLKYLFQGWNT